MLSVIGWLLVAVLGVAVMALVIIVFTVSFVEIRSILRRDE